MSTTQFLHASNVHIIVAVLLIVWLMMFLVQQIERWNFPRDDSDGDDDNSLSF